MKIKTLIISLGLLFCIGTQLSAYVEQNSRNGIEEYSKIRYQSDREIENYTKNLIKQFEGLKLTAYKDNGKWAIGYGHCNSRKFTVTPGMIITKEKADQLFEEDFNYYLSVVERKVSVPLSIWQKMALVSFTFNMGEGNLDKLINLTKQSTPKIPRLNQGNYGSVEIVLPLFRNSNGEISKGLVNRRALELALWRGEIITSK